MKVELEIITDRLPTEADGSKNGLVFGIVDGRWSIWHWQGVEAGMQWARIPTPKPPIDTSLSASITRLSKWNEPSGEVQEYSDNAVNVHDDYTRIIDAARRSDWLEKANAELAKERDDAEDAADSLSSLVLKEPVDWPFHDVAWRRAIEALKATNTVPQKSRHDGVGEGWDEHYRLLEESNECLRSCYSVAARKGESVNWDSLQNAIWKVLKSQHKAMYPDVDHSICCKDDERHQAESDLLDKGLSDYKQGKPSAVKRAREILRELELDTPESNDPDGVGEGWRRCRPHEATEMRHADGAWIKKFGNPDDWPDDTQYRRRITSEDTQ